MKHGTLGICSWSLRPSSPADLVEKMRECGLSAVQLALDPIRRGDWEEQDVVHTLQDAGIRIASGMMAMAGEDYSTLESIRRTGGVRDDDLWPEHLLAAQADADIANRLKLRLVTLHAGFLPEEACDERRVMVERLQEIAEAYGQHGIDVAFETGQERADTLAGVLREIQRNNVGVNFDPANMILYGMGDPVDALRLLSPWVKQVHIKDALPTQQPGTWGRETPVGGGAVNWREFFVVVHEHLPDIDMMIEREAGHARSDDIRAAADLVRTLSGSVREGPDS